MKKLFQFMLASMLLAGASKLNAADLVVEEFGTFPTYSSITNAVAAAVDGDRIIIKNRAGNIPWIENITVNKSLEFLSFDNDTFFVVQGNYTIVGATGRNISFIGMKNLSGSILSGSSSGLQKGTNVHILGSMFIAGGISMNSYFFNTVIAHTQIDDGEISLCFGAVIGCEIKSITTGSGSNSILVTSGLSAANDTIMLIGNKILNETNSGTGIYFASTTTTLHCRNNFITHRYMGIEMNGFLDGPINYIYNNTILGTYVSSTNYGIAINGTTASDIVELMNNVLQSTATGYKYGIYNNGSNSGQINVYYNHIDASFNGPISTGFTFVGNNTTNASFSLTADGHMQTGAPGINGGNPAAPFFDLDLSAGDAGCYGSSYTLDNFFPMHYGGARVFQVWYPFNIRQGQTLNVKAKGYDR